MAKRTTERSAACATCGKTFARSDTLLRHEKSHHATEDRGPIHRVTNGTFRACSSCAQARSRCSGGAPCGRCKTRNLECSYPNKRRKGNDVEDDGQMTFNSMNFSSISQNQTTKSEQPFPGQFQQFVFSPESPSQYHGGVQQPIIERVMSVTGIPALGPMRMSAQQPPQPHLDLPAALPATSSDAQQLSTMEANLQGISGTSQEQYNSTSVPIDYQNAFGNQQVAFGSGSLYDESLGLNWIPLSVYASPYGNMDQDFSFFGHTMSDTASMSNDFDPMAFDTTMVATAQSTRGTGMKHAEYLPPASMAGLMQSPSSTGSDHIAPVGFAFDKLDVPGVRKMRPKQSHVSPGFSQPKGKHAGFSFPEMSTLTSTMTSYICSEDKYALVVSTFEQLCVHSPRSKPFSTTNFPGLDAFNACIELYFEHLHPTFPLLHAPTFQRCSDWLTCLATAAIGSAFAPIPDCGDAQEAFQEFLRRAVLATSDDQDGDFRNIHLAQARILALIGLTQSDREQLRSRAPRSHADIARWCLESSILQLTAPDEEVRSDHDIEIAWFKWAQRESLRRVGYFIWLLDCALGYVSNARPLCNMDDARAPLPCAESLWDAPSAQEWLVHHNNTPRMPSLCAALEMMYEKKKIDPGLSEISQILLIHALYSRTWEVGTHIKQPLSEWKVTGNSKGFLNTPSKDNFWLPIYPLYANWRNSACDCLDLLHWQATATQAKNNGTEHHTLLHLHLARVILLTPFQEIQDLLFFLINHRVSDLSKASFYVHDGSYQPRNPDKLPQIRQITWRWLREDQHKARLAMIHAGSVFWHVRRYSRGSFFEPLAIYLASIVLWTYGSYKSSALGRDVSTSAAIKRPHSATMAAAVVPVTTNDTTTNNDRCSQIQPDPGTDFNVQPTRLERAANSYTIASRSKSRSSRSYSTTTTPAGAAPNPSPRPTNNSNSSPAHLHSHSHSQNPPLSPSGSPIPASPTASASDTDSPHFIHLDRPCDDDLVQHFVRNGHNMAGYMSHVGDICQTPRKVLVEGAKILRTKLAGWGVSREYHDILVRLAEKKRK